MVIQSTDQRIMCPLMEVRFKKMPSQAYRIAKGAATMRNMPVDMWIALAILEKWDRDKKES